MRKPTRCAKLLCILSCAGGGSDITLVLPRCATDIVSVQASKLLTAAPALLAMHPATLEVKVQQLRALAATHPSWAEAYCSCPPKSLAILLTYSLERQLRLHYAAAFGLQPK